MGEWDEGGWGSGMREGRVGKWDEGGWGEV